MFRKHLRKILWFLAAAVLVAVVDVFTRGDVPYPLQTTIQATVRGSDGAAIPEATVTVDYLVPRDRDSIRILFPTRAGSGTTDAQGNLTLTVVIPGTIQRGLVERALRWFGDDSVSRSSAVRTVLGWTQISAKKTGWQSEGGLRFLAHSRITKGLGGDSWFWTRPDLALEIDLVMKPDVPESK